MKSAIKNMRTGASGIRGSPRNMQTPNTYKGGGGHGMHHGQSVMISDVQGEQLQASNAVARYNQMTAN